MKKISCLAVIIITAFFISKLSLDNNKNKQEQNELRGIFISYLEYLEYFQNKEPKEIKQKIDNIIENLIKYKINNIYLQVRPFSDSIYKSEIFPFSHTISGTQGKEINIDILKIFIDKAHKKEINVHAWVNPYRISNNTDTTFISKNSPAYKWLNTNNVKIIKNKGIYYNPASKEVHELIIKGIKELVTNYNIDGILLDDYFYPDDTIDLENYKEVENTISITDFRLNNTNRLITSIYKTIKETNSNILFGISPDGNINNNYNNHYIDVKKWLKEDNYIDYIMPQLYYGFFHQTKPFIETLNEWDNLIENDVKLVIGLALYKIGELDKYAGSGSNEWQANNNIIKKQIIISRNSYNYLGYTFFRYSFLENSEKNVNLQQELLNYQKLFIKK